MSEITVEKLINNGRGLARGADGRVLFVEGALPGERWRVDEVVKRKGSYWATGERLSDAPERVAPDCPHFGRCGGCALLHIHHRFELSFKINYLRDVLSRVGGIEVGEVDSVDFPAHGSRIRGKLHADRHGHIGFHQERANQIAAIKSCHVLPPAMVALLPELGQAVADAGFEGDVYFMTDAEGKHPRLELQGSVRVGGLVAEQWQQLPAAGVVVRGWDGLPLYSHGDPLTTFHWGAMTVRLPPRAFVQSNPASWPVFGQMVTRYLRQCRPERIWDVHAGAGFLSSFLHDVEVWASEPHRGAFDQLREGLKRSGMVHRVFQGTAESAVKRHFFEARPHDGLMLDPPREGLSNPLRQWIVDHGPRMILYFSCDMGSFARDMRHLQEGYTVENPLLVMNVNPGTLRVELGAVLVRR